MQNDTLNLFVDDDRRGAPETGIRVRASHAGKYDSYDIVHLTRDSFIAWLRSRDGENPWMESVALHLMGHER